MSEDPGAFENLIDGIGRLEPDPNPPGYEHARVFRGVLDRDGRSRNVAVRAVPVDAAPDLAEAFLDTARNWRKVATHPNVVEMIQWGQEPTAWILAADDLGADLAMRAGDLDPDAVGAIVADVAEALRNAALYNVSHYNLRPEYVRLSTDDRTVRLDDWGLERTLAMHLDGSHETPYTAPELSDASARPDQRADVYGLAGLAYLALTGRPPTTDEQPYTPSDLVSTVPPAVDTVLQRGLSDDPDARPNSPYTFANEFRQALQASGGGAGAGAAGAAGAGAAGAGAAADSGAADSQQGAGGQQPAGQGSGGGQDASGGQGTGTGQQPGTGQQTGRGAPGNQGTSAARTGQQASTGTQRGQHGQAGPQESGRQTGTGTPETTVPPEDTSGTRRRTLLKAGGGLAVLGGLGFAALQVFGGDGGGSVDLEAVPAKTDAVSWVDADALRDSSAFRSALNAELGGIQGVPGTVSVLLDTIQSRTGLDPSGVNRAVAFGATSEAPTVYFGLTLDTEWTASDVGDSLSRAGTTRSTEYRDRTVHVLRSDRLPWPMHVATLGDGKFAVGTRTEVRDVVDVQAGEADPVGGEVADAVNKARTRPVRFGFDVPSDLPSGGTSLSLASLFENVEYGYGSVDAADQSVRLSLATGSSSAAGDLKTQLSGLVTLASNRIGQVVPSDATASELRTMLEGVTVKQNGKEVTVRVPDGVGLAGTLAQVLVA